MAGAGSLAAALATALLVAVPGASGAPGAEAPRRGGTVVFGPVEGPSCLNPLVCSNNTSLWITEEVLPGAFSLAPDFTLRPRLVSGVTFTTRPPFTLTYRIRPEARWSDGTPVTARDFVFTHDAVVRLLKPSAAGLHFQVRAIRALGPKTVRVVLGSRRASWRSALFFRVLPQHALAGADLSRIWTERIDNPKTGALIGSGPFLVQRWERGKQLTLVRNERYWGPHVAHLDRLVLRFCQACNAPPPAEALAALRSGASDIVLNRDVSIVSELRRLPGVSVVSTPSNGWDHLALRIGPGGHPALRDKETGKLVRRALAYGIDRVEIARRLFGDIDSTYRPLDSVIFLNTSGYYRPSWSGYRYRPAVARRLLEQAGCTRGADAIYVCRGQRLSLKVLTTAGATLRLRVLELIQPQLREAGVEVVPAFAAGPTLFDQILPRGDFEAVVMAWFRPEDYTGRSVFGCGGSQNWTGYCQRLVDGDLDQADRILDTDERARALHGLDRRLANDVPVIPLYQIPFLIAHRTALRGFVPAPFNHLWSAEDWWLAKGQ